MVAESQREGLFEFDRQGLTRRALEFSDRVAGDVAVPLSELVTLKLGATPDDVQVQMKDALSRTSTTVDGEAKIGPTVGASDLCRNAMQMADQHVVFRCQIREGRDVFPRDHENVRRCCRIDVAERDRVLVFVHAIRPCLSG